MAVLGDVVMDGAALAKFRLTRTSVSREKEGSEFPDICAASLLSAGVY